MPYIHCPRCGVGCYSNLLSCPKCMARADVYTQAGERRRWRLSAFEQADTETTVRKALYDWHTGCVEPCKADASGGRR